MPTDNSAVPGLGSPGDAQSPSSHSAGKKGGVGGISIHRIHKMLISLSLPGTECGDRAAPAPGSHPVAQAVLSPAVPGTFPLFLSTDFCEQHFHTPAPLPAHTSPELLSTLRENVQDGAKNYLL